MSDVNLQDHIVTDETEKVEIEHKGDTLEFEIKELSWAETRSILSDNLDIDQNENVDLNLDEYQKDILKEKIVDTNVPKLSIFIEKMPSEIGEELNEYVDDPLNTEEDQGN